MQKYKYIAKQNLGTPFVEQSQFNMFMGIIIVINAIVIGLDCDKKILGLDDSILRAIEDTFLVIYILELILRFFYLGFRRYFMDGFNLLDGFLVAMGVIEKLFFGDGMEAASFMRLLKIIRLIRLTRLLRLVRFFASLWLAVIGVAGSILTIISVMPIMGVLVYLFGIFANVTIGQSTAWMFTDQYSPGFENFENEELFGTVGASMLTVFQISTLAGWSDIARRIMPHFPQAAIFFICFIFLIAFGLNTVVVGTVCSRSIRQADEMKVKELQTRMSRDQELLRHIVACFAIADSDDSGELDHDEVTKLFGRPALRKALHYLGMPTRDVPTLLRLLDRDGDGQISRQEFLDGFMQFNGKMKSNNIIKVQLSLQSLTVRLADLYNRMAHSKDTILDQETKLSVSYMAIDNMLYSYSKDAYSAIRKKKMNIKAHFLNLIREAEARVYLNQGSDDDSDYTESTLSTEAQEQLRLQELLRKEEELKALREFEKKQAKNKKKEKLIPYRAPDSPSKYERYPDLNFNNFDYDGLNARVREYAIIDFETTMKQARALAADRDR